MRLLIAIPVLSNIPIEVCCGLCKSLVYMKDHDPDFEFDIIYIKRTPIWKARMLLWSMAKRYDFDKFMFLGDDIVLRDNTIHKLSSSNKKIISGVYFERMPLHRPMVFKFDDNGECICDPIPINGEIQQVEGCGLDCILIDKEYVKSISSDVFLPVDKATGDDISFMRYCKENDIPVYVHTGCVVGHMNRQDNIIGKAHYLKWKSLIDGMNKLKGISLWL